MLLYTIGISIFNVFNYVLGYLKLRTKFIEEIFSWPQQLSPAAGATFSPVKGGYRVCFSGYAWAVVGN